jgi:hypothetical protein
MGDDLRAQTQTAGTVLKRAKSAGAPDHRAGWLPSRR